MRRTARLLFQSLLLSSVVASSAAMAFDASVASRLDARNINYTVDEDGDYQVVYSYTKENRTQLVYVSGSTESIGNFTIREVFAPAALLERDGVGARALELLADSSKKKIGNWEIRGDVLYFVIKLPDGIDAEQLEQAMDIAAETADDMEITFSGDTDDL